MTLNIAHTLTDIAAKQGNSIGIIEARTNRSLSFKEIDNISEGFAHYLHSNGLKTGDKVMLMVKPSADFICLTFALFKIGAPVILIDPGMGYKNLLRCIAGVAPKVFIGIPKAHIFRKLFPKPFASVKNTFCCGFSFGLFGKDIRTTTWNGEKIRLHTPSADDLAAIIFTTGSTGPPKGVRYEHSIFAAQLRLIRDHYNISSTDIDQPAFPLFALFSTALGACAVIPDMDATRPAKVNPEKFITSIQRHRVTYSFGSPALWNVVSRYCINKKIVLDTVKLVLMAGAPVSGELIARVASILPDDACIHTPYGATESLPIVSIEGKEIVTSTWPLTQKGKGTCVGRPLPGIDIKVIPISDDRIDDFASVREVAGEEIGEIIVRGDVVTRSYENNEIETSLAKIKDGASLWHRMGDTGYLDKKGRLWFCGRRGHRVTTKDGVLFTIPCEAIINNHQGVFRSALVGIQDKSDTTMQIPVLIIEKQSSFTMDNEEMEKQIRELARSNELTKTITHILFHPEFPVDIRHNAKIFREKLSSWAQEVIEQ